MDTEKREHQRQFFDVKVRVGNCYGQSRNISIGGMSCKLREEVKTLEETPIIIYPDLPGRVGDTANAIRLTGTPLRCTPITKDIYDVGIYFNTAKIKPEVRNKLIEFLGMTVPKEMK